MTIVLLIVLACLLYTIFIIRQKNNEIVGLNIELISLVRKASKSEMQSKRIDELQKALNEEREQLNSNADYAMTLNTKKAKLKEKLISKNIMYVRALNNNNYKKKRITFLEKEVARLTWSRGIFRWRNLK